MNRRSSLALLLGKQKKATQKTMTPAATVTTSFSPYTGPWGFEQAAHLLRRTTFGPTYAQIKQATADGLDATITTLFESQPLPSPPVYYNFENDPNIPNGETWVNTLEPSPEVTGLRAARRSSLRAWTYKNIYDSGMNISEKMTLFWHNHFVVASTNVPRAMYTYITFLRENALGNFKTLVEGITVDPSMLIYLNGTANSKFAPNENFSRELLELFTIGKGAAAGPGDYTNYTEDDVVELARALTGWRFFDVDNPDLVQANFIPNRHDTGDKQLSHRFNNAVISDQGENEYKTVIDIIFQQDEVARFICRKLYRWFVHEDLNSDVEANIIEPMSQMLIADNYDIKSSLIALLSSEHFYDIAIRGCMVNHPIDFLFKIMNSMEVKVTGTLLTDYRIFINIFTAMNNLEMIYHDHPNVAGWKAFYQAPQFYKIWINAVSLPIRMRYSEEFVDGFVVGSTGGFDIKINVLDLIASLDNPLDPNDLINELASIIFARPISQEQLVSLKDILIPGLPDFEWEVEYGDYISGNVSLEPAVENKLKALVDTMTKMPEFYLI